jgi:hypothetical protein
MGICPILSSQPTTRATSALGQTRLGQADSGSGHVGYPPIAINSCDAATFRDVPMAELVMQADRAARPSKHGPDGEYRESLPSDGSTTAQ